MEENKKRGAPGGTPDSKKAKLMDGNSEDVIFKILIPNGVAGAVIGKGGETMRLIQSSAGCKMKMSKSNEVYPETSERVSQIHGQVSACVEAVKQIQEKIRQKGDLSVPPDPYDHKDSERGKEVKIVVPNTSAGMIIGKSGAYIKEIKETSGAFVQIFPKQGTPEAQQTNERCITIVGNPDEIEKAAFMVLSKVAQDPHHNSNPTITYSSDRGPFNSDSCNSAPLGGRSGGFMGGPGPDMGHPNFGGPPGGPGAPPFGGPPRGGPFGDLGGGPMPNSISMSQPEGYGGGGPMGDFPHPHSRGPPPPSMMPPPQNQSMFDQQPTSQYQSSNQSHPSYGNGTGGPGGMDNMSRQSQPSTNNGMGDGDRKFNMLDGASNSEYLQFLDALQATLKSSGFTENQVAEIMPAMQILHKYNIMGLGLGLGVAAMATMRTNQQSQEQQQRDQLREREQQAQQQREREQQQAQQQQQQQQQQQMQQMQDHRGMSDRYGMPDNRPDDKMMLGGNTGRTSGGAASFNMPNNQSQSQWGGASNMNRGGTLQSGNIDMGQGPYGGGRNIKMESSMDGSYGGPPDSKFNMGATSGGNGMPSFGGGNNGEPQPLLTLKPRVPPGMGDMGRGGPGGNSFGGDSMSKGSYANSVIRAKPSNDPSKLEIEMPEQVIGAVLGPKAQTLYEIKRYSGAQVEISKRAGAPNGLRSILITAPDPECVRAGRVMIERAINEEYDRRQQQGRSF